MEKIEHLGIAVKNLDDGEKLYSALLGTNSYKRENVESEGVATSFFYMGESKIELLAPTNDESPIAKFLAKNGPGIHHIAFAVKDIESEIDRLIKEGFTLINQTAKSGADNKLIAFLHPKSTGGMLVELCQDIPS